VYACRLYYADLKITLADIEFIEDLGHISNFARVGPDLGYAIDAILPYVVPAISPRSTSVFYHIELSLVNTFAPRDYPFWDGVQKPSHPTGRGQAKKTG
jgi:hypothetical protein